MWCWSDRSFAIQCGNTFMSTASWIIIHHISISHRDSDRLLAPPWRGSCRWQEVQAWLSLLISVIAHRTDVDVRIGWLEKRKKACRANGSVGSVLRRCEGFSFGHVHFIIIPVIHRLTQWLRNGVAIKIMDDERGCGGWMNNKTLNNSSDI